MSLTPEESERYEWQMWTPGYGEAGQLKLKAATALISRVGGVGGTVATQLAAAGIGHLILAHGGDLRRNDLNRQTLMNTERIGQPRVLQAADRLREINPNVQVTTVPHNISPANSPTLLAAADIVISAAPLFEERLAMNAAAIQLRKPIIHCAMYDMEATVLVTLPRQTACLACLTPTAPSWWKRQFPVFGAVASAAGSIATIEAIKLIANLGEPSAGTLTALDFRTGHVRRVQVARDPACPVCA